MLTSPISLNAFPLASRTLTSGYLSYCQWSPDVYLRTGMEGEIREEAHRGTERSVGVAAESSGVVATKSVVVGTEGSVVAKRASKAAHCPWRIPWSPPPRVQEPAHMPTSLIWQRISPGGEALKRKRCEARKNSHTTLALLLTCTPVHVCTSLGRPPSNHGMGFGFGRFYCCPRAHLRLFDSCLSGEAGLFAGCLARVLYSSSCQPEGADRGCRGSLLLASAVRGLVDRGLSLEWKKLLEGFRQAVAWCSTGEPDHCEGVPMI